MVGSLGSGSAVTISTVRSSRAVAVRLPVTDAWLSHSCSAEVLMVHATSSAVSGSPSDHNRPSRSV